MIAEPNKKIKFVCVLGHREGDIITAECVSRHVVQFVAGYKNGVSSNKPVKYSRKLEDLGDKLQFRFDWSVWESVGYTEEASESDTKTYTVTFKVSGYIDIKTTGRSPKEAVDAAREVVGSMDFGDLFAVEWNAIYKEEVNE